MSLLPEWTSEVSDESKAEGKHYLASMGIYIFNAKFLYEQLIRDAGDKKSSHDFGGDIIPYIINNIAQAHRFTDGCVGALDDNWLLA